MKPDRKRAKTEDARPTDAIIALDELVGRRFHARSLDQSYDLLKLIGVVLGLQTLLLIAADDTADAKSRVAAARALTQLKERPEEIVARLSHSAFAGLTIADLEAIVEKVRSGHAGVDLSALVQSLKAESGEA